MASVEQLVEVFGPQTEVAMGRELTKKFEHIYRGQARELLAFIAHDKNQQKGEFVLAIQGNKKAGNEQLTAEQASLAIKLKQHLPPKVAAKVVAEQFGINKKHVYEFILLQEKN